MDVAKVKKLLLSILAGIGLTFLFSVSSLAQDFSIDSTGRYILYMNSGQSGTDFRIHRYDTVSSEDLYLDMGFVASYPQWMPNGESFLFFGYPEGITVDSPASDSPVFEASLDGTVLGPRRFGDVFLFNDYYRLSPNGQWLLYSDTEDNVNFDFYLLNIETGESQNISNTPSPINELIEDASWSADSRFIAFTMPYDVAGAVVSERNNIPVPILYILEVATGISRQVSLPLVLASRPVWSPDSQFLAFSGLVSNTSNNRDVLLLSLDFLDDETTTSSGITLSNITHREDEALPHTMPDVPDLDWSPDGLYIVFVTDGGSETALNIVDVERGLNEGNQASEVIVYHTTLEEGIISYPRWQPTASNQ